MEDFLKPILLNLPLSREQAAEALGMLLDGGLSPAHAAAVKGFLRAHQPSVEELEGFASAAGPRAVALETQRPGLVGLCGLGGAGAASSDFLSAAALMAAGGGMAVAMQVRRAPAGAAGTADVLADLGVNVEAAPGVVGRCVAEVGLGIFHAAVFHRGLDAACPPPKAGSPPGLVDLLIALCNPAGAKRHVVGTGSGKAVLALAEVFRGLGGERALVVSAQDGQDAISLGSKTAAAYLKDGAVAEHLLSAETFSLKHGPVAAAAGRDERVRTLLAVLKGEDHPHRDSALANGAALFLVGGKASDFRIGLEMATESLDSRRALAALEKLAACSRLP